MRGSNAGMADRIGRRLSPFRDGSARAVWLTLATFRRPFRRGLANGLACTLLVWMISDLALLRGLENWGLDGCFWIRGNRLSQDAVVIVGLDDASLSELSKPVAMISPELAEVIEYLGDRGAAAIGVDILIPDQLDGGRGMAEGAAHVGRQVMASDRVILPAWQVGERLIKPLSGWVGPEPRPAENSDDSRFGLVNLTEDGDAILRRQQLVVRVEDRDLMHFAMALFAKYAASEEGELLIRPDPAGGGLLVGDRHVPLDDRGRMRINYVGPQGTIRVIPFREVLRAAKERTAVSSPLEGKIAIIGGTSPFLQDAHATPFSNHLSRALSSTDSGLMSGAEVHANIAATLVDRAFLQVPSPYAALTTLLVVGISTGWFCAHVNLFWGAVATSTFHFSWKLGIAPLAFALKWQIPIVPVLVLGALVFGLEVFYRVTWLGAMFGVFKSGAVIRALQANPDRIDFRKDQCHLTVLFADIRSFTAYSSRTSAETAIAMLNAYFSAVVPILERHGGILNQYIGDGVMVLFGAPKYLERPEYRAVCAAVEMVQRVHRLAQDEGWQERFEFPDFRVGVGIHTGRAIIGTIGSTYRKDYTAIGETVNTASRIEGLNKFLGTEILVSPETFKGLSARERQLLGCDPEPIVARVQGMGEPLLLHRVVQPGWELRPAVSDSRETARQSADASTAPAP